ncbi:TIGR02206 family membrane protein [SAR92 clade bacterium H921]|jgi:hypothetical integral membrane protein (TIGR02206 family)|nr:TIGR02206 family membrane protein [SAR92 clade bacterium H921]MDG0972266.1 TIGR02206 family membrane protein [Porticoccaceae bacterium]MDG1307502.1 TIGR02206 family membrane protein [Porticoccaceae bacterium]
MSDLLFFRVDIPFTSFSLSHWLVLVVFVFLLATIVLLGRNLTRQQNLLLARALSVFMSASVVIWAVLHLVFDRFNVAVDLPLSLCNLFALIAPLLFWNPDHRRFEVIYFMVMCGTFQAIITPDLYVGFPGYGFFKYWIVHIGLVLVVVHYLLVFRLYPRPQAMITSFVWLNIYLLSLVPVNLWLDANYFYMMEKPINPSILDYFGPWPVYILVSEALAFVFFAVAYVPIAVAKKYFINPATIHS